MSARRREIEDELDADLSGAAKSDATWQAASGMVRRLSFVCGGDRDAGHNSNSANEDKRVVKVASAIALLLPCFAEGASTPGGYVQRGLEPANRGVLQLQMKRVTSLVASLLAATNWTLSCPSDPAHGTLLKSLFILSDASLWKGLPALLEPAASQHCAGLLRQLVLSQRVLASLRNALPLASTPSPAHPQIATLLATLAIRPLSQCTGASITDSDVAMAFCIDILSLPNFTK